MSYPVSNIPSPIHIIHHPEFESKGIKFYVKRDDLIHPWVSGNKWRKLKFNLLHAKEKNIKTMITFGGAFSNHLYAVAGACKIFGLESVGIVRGDEMDFQNPTLSFCQEMGMKLHFINRTEYKLKEDSLIIQNILLSYSNAYILPEGGTNHLALKGVREIIEETYQQMNAFPDFVAVSAGTGGTAAGLLVDLPSDSKLIVFSALKSDYLHTEIIKLSGVERKNALNFISDYHFGGYAKWNDTLLKFIEEFERQTSVPIDPVYNAKMLYGLLDLVNKNYFPEGSTILWIHTGGLQGKEGLKYLMQKKITL